MAAIDIGPGATNRDDASAANTTRVALGNPADGTGTISTFEVWFNTNGTGVKVGTFYGSGTDYTSRDVETLGNVTAGSKQTFSGLDCDVVVNDFAGMYAATGGFDLDISGGSGNYSKTGDQFGAGQQTYTLSSDKDISIYGTGTTKWTGVIRLGSQEITNPTAIRIGNQELTVAQIDKVVLGKAEI